MFRSHFQSFDQNLWDLEELRRQTSSSASMDEVYGTPLIVDKKSIKTYQTALQSFQCAKTKASNVLVRIDLVEIWWNGVKRLKEEMILPGILPPLWGFWSRICRGAENSAKAKPETFWNRNQFLSGGCWRMLMLSFLALWTWARGSLREMPDTQEFKVKMSNLGFTSQPFVL